VCFYEWNDVLDKIIRLHNENIIVIHRNKLFISSLDVTQRIMRQTNYFIALVDENILGLDFFGNRRMSRVLQYTIDILLLRTLFNKQFHLICEPMNFRMKSKFIGLIQLLVLPLSLLFLLVTFCFEHLEGIHSKHSNLSTKEWSVYSHWKLSRYNELPHDHEKRLMTGKNNAHYYMGQYPSIKTGIAVETVLYCVGSCIGLLVCIGLFNDDLLTEMHVLDRSFIWWIAVLGGLIGTLRIMRVDTTQFSVNRRNEYLHKLVKTVSIPNVDKNEHENNYRILGSLFKYKILCFFDELIVLVCLPIWLMFYLPNEADAIYHYLNTKTCTMEFIGDVCVYGKFDVYTTSPHCVPVNNKLHESLTNFSYKPSSTFAEII